MCSFVIQAISDSKHLSADAQIYLSSHISCWVCSSLSQMAGLKAQDFHQKKLDFFFSICCSAQFSLLQEDLMVYPIGTRHSSTTPAAPRVMSISVKAKVHTKIRSKVCAPSNSGQQSSSGTVIAVPNQLLRCHTASKDDIF